MQSPRLIVCSLLLAVYSAPGLAQESAVAIDLITSFWTASTPEELQRSQEQLITRTADTQLLYQALKRGPAYSTDVPVGQQERVRVAGDGTRFPYVYLIPEDYDAAHPYPVEFMLHGGVSRPEWEPGGAWWRPGYDSLKQPDRIMVVPASWVDAFWWHENQAENLPAILRALKRTYNIDENRVTLSGISDGGTGAYFFAFKQPTEWAAFLPYIGHPGVLRNPQSGGGYRLYFENLMSKPLYIVNGENDRLYPAAGVQPFVDILRETGVQHVFRIIEDGGHDTRWIADETPRIEQFKLDNPRDPLPETIRWVADRTDQFNRNQWIRVDDLAVSPGLLEVTRDRNRFDVVARGVSQFTLLLNPEEVNFAEPVRVDVNGENLFDQTVTESKETLLKWASRDLDRRMLFTAEITLQVRE